MPDIAQYELLPLDELEELVEELQELLAKKKNSLVHPPPLTTSTATPRPFSLSNDDWAELTKLRSERADSQYFMMDLGDKYGFVWNTAKPAEVDGQWAMIATPKTILK